MPVASIKVFVLHFGVLASWKMVLDLVWRNYLTLVIAPAFHRLFPENSVLAKTRLSHGLHFFNILDMAYKKFTSSGKHFPTLEVNEIGYNTCENVKMLFNYFIPLVGIFHTLVKHC